MNVLWGLLSCCGIGLALGALVIGSFIVKHRVDEWRSWRRWRRRAPTALEDPRPPLPFELREDRSARRWRGGYLDAGPEALRTRAQRLLRHGAVRQARVLEAEYQSDADDWDGYVVYAFHRLDGSVAVERTVSSVNTWGAAVSQGRGAPAPAFDIMSVAQREGWLHVLLDPETGEHLIYESLMADRAAVPSPPTPPPAQPYTREPEEEAPPRPAPPNIHGIPPTPQFTTLAPAPQPYAREPEEEAHPRPAPPNIHVFPLTPQFTTLAPAPPPAAEVLSEAQTLRSALALFPTLPTNDDDSDRRVVADMLLERGFARGEFIALQTAPAPTAAHRARIAELLRTHAPTWLPPGVHPRRFEFRRGFAWAVALEKATDVQHHEWPFIRHVAVASLGGHGMFDGFEQLTLSSLTGVVSQALWYLVRGHFPRGVQHLELAMAPQELLPHAELLRALTPMERLSLRTRRQELPTSTLASVLDALPTPQRVRLSLQWGDVQGFQREVARRPWLRALELVSLESSASSLALEITGDALRVVTGGRHDALAWKALSAALRAQGFTSIPLVISETGAQREQRLD